MSRRHDRELLVRCCAMPCSWQEDGTVEICPYRVAGGDEDDFLHSVCRLFSTPGPHSVSRIARVLGITNAKVSELEGIARRKVLRAIVSDPALLETPHVRSMVELLSENAR